MKLTVIRVLPEFCQYNAYFNHILFNMIGNNLFLWCVGTKRSFPVACLDDKAC